MDARLWFLLSNTLRLTVAACAVAVPPGVVLAVLIVRTDVLLRRCALVGLILAMFIPLYLHAAAWQAGFGVQGTVTRALGSAGLWVLGVANIPWVVLIVGAALAMVDPAWEEQALLDAPAPRVFLRVTLRHVLPAAGLAALWVGMVAAGDMLVSSLFMVRTCAEELYTRTALGPQPDEPPLGSSAGIVLSLGALLAGICLCTCLAVPGRRLSLQRRVKFSLGYWRPAVSLLLAALVALIVLVPLVALAWKAGMVVVETHGRRERVFSLLKCLEKVVWTPWRARRELGWSLAIGTLAASAATASAVVLASVGLWQRRYVRAVGWLLVWSLVAACLAIPGPVLGLGIIRLLNRPELPWLAELYDRSILAPCLAQWVRGLPLATFVLWHAFQTIPRSLLDAAALDGAGFVRRVVRVAVPMRLPVVALAWLAAFVVALGELSASILVVPPGVTTISIQIFDWLHSGAEDDVAGVALALSAGLAVVAGLAFRLGSRSSGLPEGEHGGC